MNPVAENNTPPNNLSDAESPENQDTVSGAAGAAEESTPVAETTPPVPESLQTDAATSDESEGEDAPSAPPVATVTTPAPSEDGEASSHEASAEPQTNTDDDDDEDDPSSDVMGDDDGDDATDSDDDDDDDGPDESATGLKRGTLIEGTVQATSPTEILVELGEHGEGVINSRELERLTSATLESLHEGATVLTFVLSASNQDGRAVLSISRALEESDWRDAEAYLNNGDIYDGKVSGYNKGGLIVRFGRLRGFVPASQIANERRDRAKGGSPEERWGEMLGEPIYVKVVELKRSRNRLILSEQAASREVREKKKTELLEELSVGQVRQGRVTSLTEFGAFVDLGGADGLVHLTELSWTHVTHPGEVVQVGQEVEVEVISVDVSDRRIGLSMRRLGDDPWDDIADQYERGQLIQATVTKLTKFGAFARLVEHPEIEGLIHVSELSEHRVRHPREVVSKGDVLTLRIIKIEKEQRRLGLSLKQVDSPEFMDFDWRMTDDQ